MNLTLIKSTSTLSPPGSLQADWAETTAREATATPPRTKPNILFLVDQLCAPGGSERMLLKTIAGLSTRGFQCRLVTFKYNPEIEVFRHPPCPLSVFPLRRTYDLNAFRVALKIRKLIRSTPIEVVHCFHETSDLWGGMVARMSGCPVLVSSRRDMGIYRSRKHDLAYRLCNRWFDRVLTVSEEVRKYCIEADGLSPDRVTTVHNGIDLAWLDGQQDENCRRALDIAETAPVVTTVGNLRRVKGVDVLLRAAARVCSEIPRVCFVVVGKSTEDDHFENLQRLKTSLALDDNVKFLGPREDVLSLLKMSDVFCLPSRSEGFSNALIEAMASALPCVATNVGGNREAITDGANGYLLERDDPVLLADRILDLLRAPARARELGRAARKTVEERFTFDAMINKLAAIYEDLAVSRPPREARA